MSRKSLTPKFKIALPWWIELALAAVVYVGLKYYLPSMYFKNSLLNKFIHALPQFAELFAAILVIDALFSAYHAFRDRH